MSLFANLCGQTIAKASHTHTQTVSVSRHAIQVLAPAPPPSRCTHGCRVYDVAALNLSNSTVEYSGLVHAALRACDASRVAVQGCHITDNSIGVIVERDTFLTVVDSR